MELGTGRGRGWAPARANATVGKLAGAAQPARHGSASPPAALLQASAVRGAAGSFLSPSGQPQDAAGAVEPVRGFCSLVLPATEPRVRGHDAGAQVRVGWPWRCGEPVRGVSPLSLRGWEGGEQGQMSEL